MPQIEFKLYYNRDTLICFTAKNKSKYFSALMASKLYRALRFCTHTYIVSVLNPSDFRYHWAIFGPMADKNIRKGRLSRAHRQQKVLRTFVHVLTYQLKLGMVCTSNRQRHTLSQSFTTIGSLWPTLQTKMGPSKLSSYMSSKIIKSLQI